MKTQITMMATALMLVVAGPSAAQEEGSAAMSDRDIVETAVAAGEFETLVAAVQAAGLVETLKGDGPFTVFAPTDEAFAQLPDGTVTELLRPENRERLAAILTYHVVPGRVMASEVVGLDQAETVEGQSVSFSVEDGTAYVQGAEIISTDIQASNGVIHVIDEVLLPRE